MFLSLVLFLNAFILVQSSTAFIGIKKGETPKKIVLKDLSWKTVNVSRFFGSKPVIIAFWKLTENQSFPNRSLRELIFLSNLYDKYHHKYGLEVFGIYRPMTEQGITKSELAYIKDTVTSKGIKVPILIDKGSRTYQEYGVIAFPSTVMIDSEGKISFLFPGFPVIASSVLTEKINDSLGIVKDIQKQVISDKTPSDFRSIARYRLALKMYNLNFSELAITSLKKSLSINKNFPLAHNLMGILLWESGDVNGAEEEFRYAIELDKNLSAAYFNYGLLLFEKGQYIEAEERFKISLELDSTMAEAHYMLGLIYENNAQEGQALKELQMTIDMSEKKKNGSGFYIKLAAAKVSKLLSKKRDINRSLLAQQETVQNSRNSNIIHEMSNLSRIKKMLIYE
jgi:tetratricopeptide (TPR) repeat protein